MQMTLKSRTGEPLYTVDNGLVEVEVLQHRLDGSRYKQRVRIWVDKHDARVLRLNADHPVAIQPHDGCRLSIRFSG